MQRPRSIDPETFRLIAAVAWAFQALIVLSGAAVRLTEAGLGCEDWPRCSEDRLIPEFELHTWIEFGNRLISLVVALSTVVVVITARRLVGAADRPSDGAGLVRLAWLLLAGTVGQIVLGGVTVLLDLAPVAVSSHFMLSMALLLVAHLLWRRADPDGPPIEREDERPGDRPTRLLLRAILPLATVVLFTGTVLTGSGPNSGDSRADRLGFGLREVTRIHSTAVWALLACAVGLAVVLHRPGAITPSDRRLDPRPIVRALILTAVAQGAIGYTQFALGVPAGLVEAHVAGAVLVWMLAVAIHLRAFDRPAAGRQPQPAGRAAAVATLTE